MLGKEEYTWQKVTNIQTFSWGRHKMRWLKNIEVVAFFRKKLLLLLLFCSSQSSHLFFFTVSYLRAIYYFFLNCSIIALQCCVNFCCKTTQQHESAIFVCVCVCVCVTLSSWASHPSFSPLTPSHLSTHHTSRSWAPCAIQLLPTSYLIYA